MYELYRVASFCPPRLQAPGPSERPRASLQVETLYVAFFLFEAAASAGPHE